MDPSTPINFGTLFKRLAELEDLQLSIEESDKAITDLQALIDRRKQQHCPGPTPPFLFPQFRAFCLGWVNRCETATEKIRHQTRVVQRANIEQRDLLEQKLQSLGSDALRVNLEAFRLEQRSGGRDLQAAQRTDYELRRLGAEVKREMLRAKMALFEATTNYGRVLQSVERTASDLDAVQAKIERTECEVAVLERENEKLRSRLSSYRLPTILELAHIMGELRKVKDNPPSDLKACGSNETEKKSSYAT